ncbi:unnamed protein product [Vitrella brassicaformis CCMP3155]|uniref:Uncharacterized protein n=3 Tax=Vitrella brassicaformis TaxID=1169539 RepID=A0A0G4F6L9_VITBC|nr:unnamed protein product [Vitrella brassicaformis CCMP3155]|eukprot:CEM07667.1 unnamed protein product [Vitrella brassicaformis CCMP3155]
MDSHSQRPPEPEGKEAPSSANFFIWGVAPWTPSKVISRPFLTEKIAGDIKDVAIGASWMVALLENGELWSWGEDSNGCLGLGQDRTSAPEPAQIHLETHSLALPTAASRVSFVDTSPSARPSHASIRKASTATTGAVRMPDTVVGLVGGGDFVLAWTARGCLYGWGSNADGQLGVGDFSNRFQPARVDALEDDAVSQVLVAHGHSVFALSERGSVFAWGNNSKRELGLDTGKKKTQGHSHSQEPIQPTAAARAAATHVQTRVARPEPLVSLRPYKISRIESKNGTLLAHIDHGSKKRAAMGVHQAAEGALSEALSLKTPSPDTKPEPQHARLPVEEVELLQGVDFLRKVFEQMASWWEQLLRLRHGEPDPSSMDTNADLHHRANRELPAHEMDQNVEESALLHALDSLGGLHRAAVAQLKEAQGAPRAKNIRLLLTIFIDDCRLRTEKVQRTLGARRLTDLKRTVEKIPGEQVHEFGNKTASDIKKLLASSSQAEAILQRVRSADVSDLLCRELQLSLAQTMEARVQLYETQIQLLQHLQNTALHGLSDAPSASDPTLPALCVVAERWRHLKSFSLAKLCAECERHAHEYGDKEEFLQWLVKASDQKIDQLLLMQKDPPAVMQDCLLPTLCYDLLHENAELRKMANAYQLRVFILHKRAQAHHIHGGGGLGGTMGTLGLSKSGGVSGMGVSGGSMSAGMSRAPVPPLPLSRKH